MPRRVETSIDVTIWDSPSKLKKRAEVGRAFLGDLFTKHKSADYYVPADSTESVSLADFGAGADGPRGVHIESDAAITVTLNFGSGAVAIPLVLPGPVGTYAQLFLDASPASITLTNAATTGAANVTVTAWGSTTPA